MNIYLTPSDSARSYQCVVCGMWSGTDTVSAAPDAYSTSRLCGYCATGGERSAWIARARAASLRRTADWIDETAELLRSGSGWPTSDDLKSYRLLIGKSQTDNLEPPGPRLFEVVK